MLWSIHSLQHNLRVLGRSSLRIVLFCQLSLRFPSQVVPVATLDFTAMVQGSAEGNAHLRFLVDILLASVI